MTAVSSVMLSFPKPVLMPMKTAVVEERKSALETFMSEAIAEPQLSRLLLQFLGVSLSETDSLLQPPLTRAFPVPPCPSPIHSFHLKLRSTPNNRLQILTEFDLSFFQHSHCLLPDTIRLLLGDLILLTGDNICGNKAVAVLSKLITTGRVKNSHEFRCELLRSPVELLREMHLESHLRGIFPGGSYEEAFIVGAVLDQGLPHPSVMQVLEESEEAYKRLKAWRSREMLNLPCNTVRKHSEEWMEADCSHYPGLSIQYQCDEEGFLHMAIALRIEASPERLAECILKPELRHQWDKWLRTMAHLRTPSPSTSVTFIAFDYDFHQVSVLTYVEQKVEPSGLLILFRRIEDMNQPENVLAASPFICSYSLVPLSGSAGCQVLYQTRHSEDFRRFLTQDLLEERNMLKSNWWRLKQLAESKQIIVDSPGLSKACDSKILKRREKRHKSMR